MSVSFWFVVLYNFQLFEQNAGDLPSYEQALHMTSNPSPNPAPVER